MGNTGYDVVELLGAGHYKKEVNMPVKVSQITQYNYQFHGGPDGYQNSRSILRLKAGNTSVAYVHFVPEGNTIPNDYLQTSTGWIRMFMPESALPSVIDMLRNESPIYIYHVSGTTRLYTGNEPVGEEESAA